MKLCKTSTLKTVGKNAKGEKPLSFFTFFRGKYHPLLMMLLVKATIKIVL